MAFTSLPTSVSDGDIGEIGHTNSAHTNSNKLKAALDAAANGDLLGVDANNEPKAIASGTFQKAKALVIDITHEDYGATPGTDSTTSAANTTAIQAVWDELEAAGGGYCFVPGDDFGFTRLSARSNVQVVGVGIMSGLICTDPATDPANPESAIVKPDDGNRVVRFGMSNVALATARSGVASAQDDNSGLFGLNLAACERGHFANLQVLGFGMGAIVLARAEGGTEGLGFTNTNEDGNYNAFFNVWVGASGIYNDDGAAVWFKYKANSNRFYSLFGKGSMTNVTVFNESNQNLVSGLTGEAVDRPVLFKDKARGNRIDAVRGEGIVNILKAEAGSLYNSLNDYYASSISGDVFDIHDDAQVRILGQSTNRLRTGPAPSDASEWEDNFNLVDLVGLVNGLDGRIYVKAPGSNTTQVDPIRLQFHDRRIAPSSGTVLAELEIYNNDSSTGAAGVNAILRAIANGAGGQTGWSFLTGKGGAPAERMQIDSNGNVHVANTESTPPTPSSGGTLYVEGGALKYIGSSGTVTTIANA